MTRTGRKGAGRLAVGVLTIALATTPLTATAGPAAALSLTSTVTGLLTTTTGLLGGGTQWGDAEADKSAVDENGAYSAAKDAGSLYTITKAIGARELWARTDARGRAITGRGVTVAVLDSGVARAQGLDAPGKLVQGPDLSLEANSDQAVGDDTFGHGTHMASIIGARDAVEVGTTGTPLGKAGQQLGVAPDATLLALKMATTDGSTDVSQIIAALDWLVQHRNDNGMNLRVVNLSFGTGSLQGYQVDPLAAAAENAWRHGLVVVVSGGNDGPDAGRLSDPAIDPYVIATGASDPRGSVDGWKTPVVAAFSSRGTTSRHVDLVAPGRSVVGLRSPGSFVDANNPQGRVAGDASERLFRGSGTSQAAAVVSGAAALLLQAYPELTPDQVKAAFVSTATNRSSMNKIDGGAGQIQVAAAADAVRSAKATEALAAGLRLNATTMLDARQTFTPARGTGSLEAARGGGSLVDPDTGAVLQGEVDVQGVAWDGAAWAQASRAATAWSGGSWNGSRWSGPGWVSGSWARADWSGLCWSRARWSDAHWDRARWSGARWSDASWEGARWSSGHWS